MRILVLLAVIIVLAACAPSPGAQTPLPLPATATNLPPTVLPVQATERPSQAAPSAIPATPSAIPATPSAIPITPSAIPATPTALAAKPGEYESSIVVGGETRDYILHIPPGYNGAQVVPLVFVLHPYNGSDKAMEKATGMSAKADQENFIAVYPNGTGTPRAWNALFFPVRPSLPDDVAFIRTLMDQLEKDLRVDNKRIYAGGFSNGAMLSYRLGAELSDRFAAIAVAAGSIGAKQAGGSILTIPQPAHPLPVIAFQGKLDVAVPYAGGVGFEGVHFLSVADSVGFWVKQDGCKSTPQTKTSQKGNVVETDYDQCKEGSEVVLYSIGNGRHDWPNAAMANQISATDAAWEFFARHPKP